MQAVCAASHLLFNITPMKPKFLLFPLLLLLLSQRVLAQPTAAPESYLPTLLARAGIPGASMAFINPRGVVWSKGFGVREAGQSELVDQHTVFSAASLGKPVFAYLVLKLADEGKIDLDKPLYQYVPYRAIEHDPRYRAMTARMVLSHQTGFPNWRSGQLNLLFPPGRRFSYSGEGFVYLQGVVMTIMGQEIEELAQAYVFKPLGMSRSSYRWQPAFATNHATPHNRLGQPTPLTRFAEANVAVTLQTTATDYGRFLVALLTGYGLKPATAQALFIPQVTPGQTLRDATHASANVRWGLGIGLWHEGGENGFWHWGDNGDFRCFAYVSRTRQEGLVFFTNSRNGLSILSALTQRALGVSGKGLAEFLEYDTYRSPAVQASRRVAQNGAVAARPFLAAKPNGKPRLPERELLDLAEQLGTGPQPTQATELLELGSTAYPHSSQVLQALGFACLKQGDRPRAQAAFARYATSQPHDEAAQHLMAQLTQEPTGNVTLRLPGYSSARLITLAGSFNNWQPLHTLFRQEAGVWRCTLQLPTGKYLYKIIVDGNWQTDPGNPKTETDSSGNTNSLLLVEKE
jgi:CubicO group peptidase (beta-lactamase class C family)